MREYHRSFVYRRLKQLDTKPTLIWEDGHVAMRRTRTEASMRSSYRAAMAKPGRMHNKLAGAPDYDDPEFWDFRFATGRDVGEWLNSGEALLDVVLSDLERRPDVEGAPRILHLGPGVSQLGMKLRDACTERDWMGSGIVVSLIARIA